MDRFLVWVLGTWHASVLLAAFMVGAHATGAAGTVAAAIGTVAGLLAFAWLWGISVWSAWRVLEGTGHGARNVGTWAGLYGAAAGALFVAGLGTVTLLVAFVEQGWDVGALLALPVVAVVSGVAALPGALVGWALLAIDRMLVRGLVPEVSPAPRQRT